MHSSSFKNIDMTQGPILKELVLFSVPLLIGNLFQQLYNTADSIVVGNFVSSDPLVNANALGAVTSVAPAINTLVGLFIGMSTGASVVISQFFGAKNKKSLRKSIHTAMVATLIMGFVFMALGYLLTPVLLSFMDTPENITGYATSYLRIYFLGILGLMFYNMTSAILRAVGDSVRPLIFLIVTSVLNVVLDLFFVITLKAGVAGAAYATILSQFISAFLGLYVLWHTDEIYSIRLKEMKIDPEILKRIFSVGLPAGFQMAIISFSNVFVQAYINGFGEASTSGWGAYGRIDGFVMLPLQSIALALTTLVGQNAGAKKIDRIKTGIRYSMILSAVITLLICVIEFAQAPVIIRFFGSDQEVMKYGILFIRCNCIFDFLCASNQIHAGALRGVGDAAAPMFIMIFSFVIFRQIYLGIITHLTDSVIPVSLSYPAGWLMCSFIMFIYFRASGWEKKITG